MTSHSSSTDLRCSSTKRLLLSARIHFSISTSVWKTPLTSIFKEIPAIVAVKCQPCQFCVFKLDDKLTSQLIKCLGILWKFFDSSVAPVQLSRTCHSSLILLHRLLQNEILVYSFQAITVLFRMGIFCWKRCNV